MRCVSQSCSTPSSTRRPSCSSAEARGCPEALVRQPPAGGKELDSLLGALVVDYTRIEALAKDIQHRPVFTQHLRDEMSDPALLGDGRQSLDQDRAEAAAVQVVGDLDRDFRAGRVELT